MIASMTGFARRETSGEWGTLVCELRSVNHRFLEAGLRLPDELRAAEGELRTRLTRQLRRGKDDCTITYRRELLEQRCTALEALVVGVRARLPEVQARMRTRLKERLAELTASVDPERLEQELALLLQRLDVDEELERLAGHISEVRRVIGASEPAGRRLDFLMQELNREANTLSSKSQDLETTRSAVDMKVLIEQMREQVQNAE